MKQSYIGSVRPADHREHHDRSFGRGSPKDFILRMDENGVVESVSVNLTDEVKTAILKTIDLIDSRENLPIRAVIGGISVQIYQLIKFNK